MEKKIHKVAIDPSNLKKVAITCKCGNRFVEEVPGEVLDVLPMVLTCPLCKQEYGLTEGKLVRLDDYGGVTKVVERKVAAPGQTQETVDDPALNGKYIHKGNGLVN